MKATGLVAFAGAMSSRRSDQRRRRMPSQEARLHRAVDGAVAEVLEGRRLLSSVSFSSGVWTLNADNTTETIYVYRLITSSPTTDKTKFEINTNPITTYERDTADITSKIVVHANNGNDLVIVETQTEVNNDLRIDSTNASGSHGVNKVVEVNGGFGDDTIWGGDLADTLNGDSGTDDLRGRDGADAIESLSVAGGDYADGGNGNDTIGFSSDSDTGVDTFDGGEGNDTIYGGGGADDLSGGGGADYLYGNSGNDTFHSDDDVTDYLDGGDGSDTATDRDVGTDVLSNMEFT